MKNSKFEGWKDVSIACGAFKAFIDVTRYEIAIEIWNSVLL